MKLIYIVFLSVLLFGCKNVITKEETVHNNGKVTVHLVEPETCTKTITVKEVPLNVKMDSPPVSNTSTQKLPELASTTIQPSSSEQVTRPTPEVQPVPSEIVVSANSAMAMIIILALRGFGIFYFVIKNGKK